MKTRRVFAFALTLLFALSLAVQTASAADLLLTIYDASQAETAQDVLTFLTDVAWSGAIEALTGGGEKAVDYKALLTGVIRETIGESSPDSEKHLDSIIIEEFEQRFRKMRANDSAFADIFEKAIAERAAASGKGIAVGGGQAQGQEHGQQGLDALYSPIEFNINLLEISDTVLVFEERFGKLMSEVSGADAFTSDFFIVEDGILMGAASAPATKTTEDGTFLQGGVFFLYGDDIAISDIQSASDDPNAAFRQGKLLTRTKPQYVPDEGITGVFIANQGDGSGSSQTFVSPVSLEWQAGSDVSLYPEPIGGMVIVNPITISDPSQTPADPTTVEYAYQTVSGTLLYGLNSTVAKEFGGYKQMVPGRTIRAVFDSLKQGAGTTCTFCGEVMGNITYEHGSEPCGAHCRSQKKDASGVKLQHKLCRGCEAYMCVARGHHALSCGIHFVCLDAKDSSDHTTKCPSKQHFLCEGCPCEAPKNCADCGHAAHLPAKCTVSGCVCPEPILVCAKCGHEAHTTYCTVLVKGTPCGCDEF